jgi:hypothetical protein
MPTAIVSPKDLVTFAQRLEKVAGDITKRKAKASRFVSDSRSVWKDAKYDQFYRVFDQTVRDLDRFARLTNDYSRFLQRKAALARKYLENR